MNKPITLVENPGDPPKLSLSETDRSKLVTFGYEYLQEKGWFNQEPMDDDGYIPWYTYPSISFLKDILNQNHNVLEYGSGYSTLFYKNKVGYLETIEHDEVWANKMLEKDSTLNIRYIPQDSPVHPDALALVSTFIEKFPQIRTDNHQHDLMHGLINNDFAGYATAICDKPKGFYNIVVVDGMARNLTGILAAHYVRPEGYIILDNSDRWHYNQLQQFLIQNGFNRLDFWGPGYGAYKDWCTSIFSRTFNFVNNKVDRQITNGAIQL